MRAVARGWIDFMRLVGGWLVLSACMGVMLLMGCRPGNAETALEWIEKAAGCALAMPTRRRSPTRCPIAA